MTYRSDTMELSVVREVISGHVNDVYVCRDISSPHEVYYTLVVLKDHSVARQILETVSDKDNEQSKKPYIECFTHEAALCFVYEYHAERPIDRFFMGEIRTLYVCEQICIGVVIECIASKLPYPMLYLVLSQGNVHIERDGSIYFTYYFDFTDFNHEITEQDCVGRCAELILNLLKEQAGKNSKSFELINMKIERHAYNSFSELYKDIKLTAVPERKQSLWLRFKSLLARNKDRMFRILLVLCVLCAITAIVILLSHLIFGEVPLFRLFIDGFDKIGTENMKDI